jgi:hypothetical protein
VEARNVDKNITRGLAHATTLITYASVELVLLCILGIIFGLFLLFMLNISEN